jgi:uncharacterized membrane protein
MPEDNSEMKSSRLEAFSDGVIAVIITIMVLELHVPHDDGWAGLWAVLPRLAVYLLSFLIVGIYWINHHELVRRVETISFGILWSNLIFLFSLSLIPYFVDYLDEKHFSPFSTMLYESTMILAGATYFLLRWTVMQKQRKMGSLRYTDESEQWKHIVSMCLYFVSVAMAFYRPWISLAINGLVNAVWVIPQIGARQCDDEAALDAARRGLSAKSGERLQ